MNTTLKIPQATYVYVCVCVFFWWGKFKIKAISFSKMLSRNMRGLLCDGRAVGWVCDWHGKRSKTTSRVLKVTIFYSKMFVHIWTSAQQNFFQKILVLFLNPITFGRRLIKKHNCLVCEIYQEEVGCFRSKVLIFLTSTFEDARHHCLYSKRKVSSSLNLLGYFTILYFW